MVLSYQHIYHAGHFADVQKHAVLLALLSELMQKPAPLFMLDTHAGRGTYDLKDPLAQKTGEYKVGAGPLCAMEKKDVPPVLHDFYEVVKPLYEMGFYDGTAMICAKMRRAQDSAHLCEKHQGEYAALKKAMHRMAGVHCHLRDGYEGLGALIPPPKEFTRAVIITDPAYEDKKEFISVVKAIEAQQKRYNKGIFVLWYPILAGRYDHEMKDYIKAQMGDNIYHISLLFKKIAKSMKGTGIIVFNPPWQFDLKMKAINQAVADVLAEPCEVVAEWLVKEGERQDG
jgi:23S rRNA (adenine2030-N6)-methyltransferase